MPVPYKDTGGLPTIGYGVRITPEEVSKYAKGITEPQGLQMMQDYLKGECAELSQLPLAGFSLCQQDAIVSLAYNIGSKGFTSSIIYKVLINRGVELHSWLNFVRDAHGQISTGLVTRRQRELRLFIYGEY